MVWKTNMRRPLIAANWKMYGNRQLARELIGKLVDASVGGPGPEVLICPPSPYISYVGEMLESTGIVLGAQNMHQAEEGAFTGEISAPMLMDLGCRYVIIGHSERRQLFAETDAAVAAKCTAAVAHGLIPIVCVGETAEQRSNGKTEEVILMQIEAIMDNVEILADAVIAYEPVWAIGTGLTASPEQAQEVHALIRATVARRDANVAEALRIVYGGSVKAANAGSLFVCEDIDGALVGGASLKPDEFISICKQCP
jgi:triosephosphate isomerase (TIM)